MNLEPTPKPVRIRIKSAGEEHSSLKSLRGCFKYSDLLPLIKDGRFARWLRKNSEVRIADEINALQEVDKFSVVRILFNEDSITDEVSLLKFFRDSKAYLANYWCELNDLSLEQKKEVYELRTLPPVLAGDIALLLGDASESIEDQRKYYKAAANRGVERAKEELQYINQRENTLMSKRDLFDRTSLQSYIYNLSNAYWNVRPFPEGKEFEGSFYRYYLFFRFAYEVRHANESQLQSFFMREDGTLSYWERYKEIEDSYLCVFKAIQAYKRIAPDDMYRREIKRMELPRRLTDILGRISPGLRTSSNDVIDELCRDYWTYLEFQNEKKFRLW